MDPKTRERLLQMSREWRNTENRDNRVAISAGVSEFDDLFYNHLTKTSLTETHNSERLYNKGRNLEDILKIGNDKVGLKELLRIYYTDIFPDGVPFWSGKHFGVIPNTGHYIYYAALHIVNVTQKMSANNFTGAKACAVVKSVLDWVTEMVGYPEESRGVFVSGTSMGIVLALCAARDDRLKSCTLYPSSVIYMTDQTHVCQSRAINVVGLRDCILRMVPKDECHRMDPRKLEDLIIEDKKKGLYPFLVVGSLGTTGLGVVDPLEEIAKLAEEHKIWFHVDGAYGGFLLLSDKIKQKYKGINLSNSMTLDCHKGLSAQFGSAVVLVRDGSILKRSMNPKAAEYIPYLTGGVGYEAYNYSFETSRPFRSFPVWFALKYFGLDAMKKHIEEKLLLTEYAYKRLCNMADIEVFMKPDLTIIAFRYSPTGPAANGLDTNDVTRKLMDLISADDTIYLTSTVVDGIFLIRLGILSLRHHIEEVDFVLDVIARKLEGLRKSPLRDFARMEITHL